MALSVQTPRHLQSVGLLQDVSDSFEADINYLLKSAMEKVVAQICIVAVGSTTGKQQGVNIIKIDTNMFCCYSLDRFFYHLFG